MGGNPSALWLVHCFGQIGPRPNPATATESEAAVIIQEAAVTSGHYRKRAAAEMALRV
jgi:hypothetical protein